MKIKAPKLWSVLSSDKTITFIKLLAAGVTLIHAIEEFKKTPAKKKKIGFGNEE